MRVDLVGLCESKGLWDIYILQDTGVGVPTEIKQVGV